MLGGSDLTKVGRDEAPVALVMLTNEGLFSKFLKGNLFSQDLDFAMEMSRNFKYP